MSTSKIKQFGIALMLCAMAAILVVGRAHAQSQTDDDMSQWGKQGQQFGQQILPGVVMPQYTPGGERGAGTVTVNGQNIPINQLAPGADPAAAQKLQSYYGATTQQMEAAAQEKRQALSQDAGVAGQAYRTLLNQKTQSTATLLGNSAAALEASGNTLRDIQQQQVQQQFGACTETTEYYNRPTQQDYITNQETCEQINIPQPATIATDVAMGGPTDVTVLEETRPVTADTTFPFDGTSGLATGQTILTATYTLNWSGPVLGVAFSIYPSSFNNWQGALTVSYDPSGGGAAENAVIEVDASMTTITQTFTASPANPLMASDNFCTAQWTCQDDTPRVVDGVAITPDMISPLYPPGAGNTPASALNPICWKATSTYSCPFNLGNFGCWKTPDGGTNCQTNTVANTTTNTCGQLITNQCSIVRSECAGNAKGFGDFCYVTNETYDCPTKVDVTDISSKTTYNCQGAIRCMGNDCADPDVLHEDTHGLATTQAQLNVVQHMLSDVTLDPSSTVQSPTGETKASPATAATKARARRATSAKQAATPSPSDELIFPGNAFECRKALGSTLDCCTQTNSGGNQKYLDIYRKQERQGNAKVALAKAQQDGEDPQGGWSKLQSQSNWKLDTLSKPLTSSQETVTEDQPDGIDSGNGVGQTNSLQPAMTAYRNEQDNDDSLKHSWGCTSAELDLATQREAGACLSIGAYCEKSILGACLELRDVYCCFNSALSRSIREQIAGGTAGILAGAFGTPQQPVCGGVPVSTVRSTATLNNLDLGDWIARNQVGGGLPTLESLAAQTSADKLTGQGSTINPDGKTRPNVIDRTQARVGAIDVGGATNAMETQAAAMAPPPEAAPTVAGTIAFGPAYYYTYAGLKVGVTFFRTGGQGAVSAQYVTSDDTAIAGVNYTAASGSVSWADGETGTKVVMVSTLPFPKDQPAQQISFNLKILSTSGGAALGTNTDGEVVINPGSAVASLPPAPTANLAVSKSVVTSAQASGSTPAQVTYNVRVQNTGSVSLSSWSVTDQIPQGTLLNYGNTADPQWNTFCANHGWYQMSNGASVVWCVNSAPFAPGAVLNIPVTVAYPNTAVGTAVTNTCWADFVDPAKPNQWQGVGLGTCQASATIPGTATGAGGYTCQSGIAPMTSITNYDWTSIMGAAFPQGTKSELIYLTTGADGISQIDVPDGTTGRYQIHVTPMADTQFHNPAANAVYARISPCLGDLALPTNAPGSKFGMQSCTTASLTGGKYGSTGTITLSLGDTADSTPASCNLPAGTYFLNMAMADPQLGPIVPEPQACSSSICTMVMTITPTN